MKTPMAHVHNENHENKIILLRHFWGEKSLVIRKPFQTKSATSIVAGVAARTCSCFLAVTILDGGSKRSYLLLGCYFGP